MSANKILFGIEQLHVAYLSDTAIEGTPAWDAPITIPGVVGFATSPEGDITTFYADNVLYYEADNNNGYTGDIELAKIPDAVLAEILGQLVDTNGMLIESADDVPKKFALMGQMQGDAKNRRFVYYNCKANRPGQENNTKTETTEPDTETLPIIARPVLSGEKMLVKGVMELNATNQIVYDAFFDAVTLPDAVVV